MWSAFSFTSFKLLSARHGCVRHAEKEQSYTFLETETRGTQQSKASLNGKWATWWLSNLPSGKVWQGRRDPGLLSSQSRWRTGPASQDAVLVPPGKNRLATWREATSTEKQLDEWRHFSITKTDRQSMGNWYSFCTQIMTEVQQLSLKSSTAEGWLLKSDNLVGDKPLRPRWQSHLSCPYQCTDWMDPCLEKISCDRDHLYRKSWEASRWHYSMGFSRRDPLGSSDFWHLLARLELSGWSMVKACFAVSNDALREVAGQAVELML